MEARDAVSTAPGAPSSRVAAKRRIEGRLPRKVGGWEARVISSVMPGLVPGIHVSRRGGMSGYERDGGTAWMPGTSL